MSRFCRLGGSVLELERPLLADLASTVGTHFLQEACLGIKLVLSTTLTDTGFESDFPPFA